MITCDKHLQKCLASNCCVMSQQCQTWPPWSDAGDFVVIATSQVAQAATALGQRWQEAILDLCDDHFFFSQVGFATLQAGLGKMLLYTL